MKKSIQLFAFVAVAAALIIAGCKGVNNSDPKSVLTAFMEKLAKKDIDGAAKLATADSKTTLDMMKKGIEMGEKMKDSSAKDPMEEFKNIQIGDAKIDGDNATVPMTSKKENKTMDIPLKKEGGAWKVDFSMATLMKMGQDEKNKMDMDDMHSDTDTNVNYDSAGKEAERMVDSLMKTAPKN